MPATSPVTPFQRVLVAACGSSDVVTLPQSILAMRFALGLQVRVVLSAAAASFVTARAFTAVTGEPAHDEHPGTEAGVAHLDLARWADLVLVMPATANTIGKAAHGIADSLLTTCILAAAAPVVFVPSMNAAMWDRPAVQRNVEQLRADGHGVVPPVGVLALSTGTVTGRGAPPIGDVLQWAADFVGQGRDG
ncbi:flavoprotein [Catellatospora sp. NPDC049609]|uniref:flavoprotein n=1 Tax=Catellatospora sp. NPDC049609 TaxID=3155505 RepID=UPI0034298F0B